MFLLTLVIAATNVALGYALAVYLGWAKLPDLRKDPVPGKPRETSADPGH